MHAGEDPKYALYQWMSEPLPGHDEPGRPGDEPLYVHVDADGVYWTQHGGTVWVGSLDGQQEPRQIARLSTVAGEQMSSDARHLYILDRQYLFRWAKGEWTEERIELPWDHTGGALAVDDRYAYAVMWGCAAITRMDKQTLSLETIYLDIGPVTPERSVGHTTLLVDNGAFYCGAWNHIFVIDRWPDLVRLDAGTVPDVGGIECCEGTDCYPCGAAKRILNGASRIRGMAVVGADVFWVDNPSSSSWVTCIDEDGAGRKTPVCYASVGKVPKQGGAATVFADRWGTGASPLFYAPNVGKLFYLSGGSVHSFDPKTTQYARVLPDLGRTGIRVDDRYVYWTWYGARVGRIQRMPLDQEPESVRESRIVELSE
jgi:hypothetical protein